MRGCWSIFHWQGCSTVPFYFALLLPRLALRVICGKTMRNHLMQKWFNGKDTDSYYELLLSVFPKQTKLILDRIIWTHRHEAAVKTQIQSQKGELFVDVGAYHGVHTRNAVKTFERVIAIEPDPQNVRRLEYNLNGTPNVQVIPCAIADFHGTTDLFLGPRNPHRSLKNTSYRKEKHRVPVTTLSHVLRREPRVDLIKVDVERAETEVFHGAMEIMGRVRAWIIEVHDPKERLAWERKVQTFGYRTEWLDGIGGGHLYAYQEELH